MAGLLEIVSTPVSGDEPCGPDLEQIEDKDYWIFIGRVDPALPKSLQEYEKFAGKNMPIAADFAAGAKLLARSHDLKLLTLLARLCLLSNDLDGFIDALRAIDHLVSERWDEVHPQGDIDYRLSLIECFEFMPDTGYPLRDIRLFSSPRLGHVSYKQHLVATGALSNERLSVDEDEDRGASRVAASSHDISVAAKSAKTADILAARDKFAELVSVVERLETQVSEKAESSSLRLPVFQGLLSSILSFLNQCLSENDPSLAPVAPAPTSLTDEGGIESSAPALVGAIASFEGAAAALKAVEAYFARNEPSSPARLYIAQARGLMGKTFAQAVEALVPAYMDQAYLPVGGGIRARLPLGRIAGLVPPSDNETGGSEPEGSEDGALENGGAPKPSPDVPTRQAAVQQMDAVVAFYRQKEPSSPVPLLLVEARTFALRDFLGSLRSVLPADVFAVDE